MSTLKTHNLQSPDASSVNIALAPNAGMVVTGISTFSGGVKIPNNTGKLELGSSQQFDLSINGSGEALINTTGVLNLSTTSFRLRRASGSHYLMNADQGGGLYLYYNGSEKFRTTNTGAVVTGILTATSFKGDGSQLSNLPASAPVGGSSSNKVFFENDKVVSVNYQITSTKNAMTAGPISINSGIGVTVPSGCSWTIV